MCTLGCTLSSYPSKAQRSGQRTITQVRLRHAQRVHEITNDVCRRTERKINKSYKGVAIRNVPFRGDHGLRMRKRLGVESKEKVDDDGEEEHDGENGGSESVVVGAGTTVADGARSPVICQEGVDHDCHSDKGEHCGRDTADLVTKVEKTSGKRREGDGEVEP